MQCTNITRNVWGEWVISGGVVEYLLDIRHRAVIHKMHKVCHTQYNDYPQQIQMRIKLRTRAMACVCVCSIFHPSMYIVNCAIFKYTYGIYMFVHSYQLLRTAVSLTLEAVATFLCPQTHTHAHMRAHMSEVPEF